MSLSLHMERLKHKHSQLKTALSCEYLRPLPNSSVISYIKHQKLALKDQMQRLAAPQ